MVAALERTQVILSLAGGAGALQEAFDTALRRQNPLDRSRVFFDTGDSYGTGALEGRAEALLGRFRAESADPQRAVIGGPMLGL